MGVDRVPIRSLSRGRQERLQRSKSFGDVAEELVGEWYDVDLARGAEWFDLEHQGSGAKYQVKSTPSTIGGSYPGAGRFRLWESQHRSLTASEGQGTAWYCFVLLHEGEGELWFRRMFPSTVTRRVRERGGWNRSGHKSYERQHKLPWTVVFGD